MVRSMQSTIVILFSCLTYSGVSMAEPLISSYSSGEKLGEIFVHDDKKG